MLQECQWQYKALTALCRLGQETHLRIKACVESVQQSFSLVLHVANNVCYHTAMIVC